MKHLLLLLIINFFQLNFQNLIAQDQFPDSLSAITDSSEYIDNGYYTRVTFTIHNNSSRSFYFPHCGEQYGYYIQKKTGEKWSEIESSGIVCLAIYISGIKELAKDSTYINFYSCHSGIGTYRLVFPFSLDLNSTDYDSLLSNEYRVYGPITGISTIKSPANSIFNMSNSYPNPFNSSTIINYSIPKQSEVLINLTDVLGREIKVFVNEIKPEGDFSLHINLYDLPSGIYFVKMESGNFTETKKIILMK